MNHGIRQTVRPPHCTRPIPHSARSFHNLQLPAASYSFQQDPSEAGDSIPNKALGFLCTAIELARRLRLFLKEATISPLLLDRGEGQGEESIPSLGLELFGCGPPLCVLRASAVKTARPNTRCTRLCRDSTKPNLSKSEQV